MKYLSVCSGIEAASDAARYKALGNSWAINCARWIGQRIAAVDAIYGKSEKQEMKEIEK